MEQKKVRRTFSEAFKREKVKMLEERQVTVKQLSRIYEVSETAIYKWIRTYSTKLGISEKIVVEKESEGTRTLALMKQVAELERIVGQKQMQVDYFKKLIELIEEDMGEDMKKKFESVLLHGLSQIKPPKV
ncbi:MAG: transposase [Bacteroidales bacterium]|nr:transposase [Bacteroidales bacterium]MBK6345999.1 transposase [Bacteroidales bacterium]MBK9356068.1 transposase [Bacteroidales bacterium]